MRPHVAELARVATFLASEGKALNLTAYALFVDAVSDNLLPAHQGAGAASEWRLLPR